MRADTYERHLADGKHWNAAGFLEALHRNGSPTCGDTMTRDCEDVY